MKGCTKRVPLCYARIINVAADCTCEAEVAAYELADVEHHDPGEAEAEEPVSVSDPSAPRKDTP